MSGDSASVILDVAVSSTDDVERRGNSPVVQSDISSGLTTGATGSAVYSGVLGPEVNRSAWPEWMTKQISLIEGSPVMGGEFQQVLRKFVELETLLGFPKGQVRRCPQIAGNDRTDDLNRAGTTSSTRWIVPRKSVGGSMAGEKGRHTFRTLPAMLRLGKRGGSPCSQVPDRNANCSVLLMLVRNGRNCGREVSTASLALSSVLSGGMLRSRILRRARSIVKWWRMFPGFWIGCWMMERVARSVLVVPPMRSRSPRGVWYCINSVRITKIAEQGKGQMTGKQVVMCNTM